jgi:hypothetical protein
MTIPYTNTTCDIYRAGRMPPAAPDVAGVQVALNPRGQSTLTTGWYTHLLLVNPTVDIRDDFQAGGATPSAGVNADTVYVPDKNGTKFTVILVRRKGRGTALDLKEVLLQRVPGANVNWPSNDV